LFRSAARWSRTKLQLPYFVYLDAVFHTFFHNTFRPDDFVRSDVERIFEEEAKFLENAEGVFFESHWGMQKAKDAYSLTGPGYINVGRGGALNPPDSDTWNEESRALVTVAMDFRQKGGDIVMEAFTSLKPRFPGLTWHIIGGRPAPGVDTMPGVTWEGILDPGKPDERMRLQSILAKAFLLVHPTREDTSPLVITEAAYFGCPSISVHRFAIPELVVNGVTGILLESIDSKLVTEAITALAENPRRYADMRRNARSHALRHFTWNRVGSTIAEHVTTALSFG
jgi:glycosyltransferase involved in cell wall biosynthesis